MATRDSLEPQAPEVSAAPPQFPVAELAPGGDEVVVEGVIRSLRIGRWAHGAVAELVLADRSGRIVLRFTDEAPAIAPGQRVVAQGIMTTGPTGPTMTDPVCRPAVTGS